MTAHTPGPWFVDGLIVTAREKGSIGFAYGPSMPEKSAVGRESLANARLIASAPELLDALKLAVNQNEHDMLMTGEELRACAAAIAKATGGGQ